MIMVNYDGLWLIEGGFQLGKWGYLTSWMVFVRENPIKIRMMTGGTPMTQETTIWETTGYEKKII